MHEPSAVAAPRRWGLRIVVVLLAAVVIPVGASVLYTFSPLEASFYPGCTFFKLTGLHCPGCGATRCVHSLLHGDIEQAFAWNPLFLLLLPLLAYGIARLAYEIWTGRRAIRYNLPGAAVKSIAVVLTVFWIARNIPVYPLNLLAPHELEDRVAIRVDKAKQVEAQNER